MQKLIFPLLLFLTIHQLQSQDILVMMGASTNQLSKAEGMALNLEATGAFDSVDAVIWDANNKYDMNFLNEYDAILVVTDGGYNSSFGMGAALKTYVDNGGGVGVFLFANASIQIGGSWNYHALEPAGQSMGPTNFGTIDIPTHSALNYPFTINTSTWNIGSLWSSTSNTLAAEAYSIAKFSDGRPALQARENVGVNGTGRVIDFAVSPLAANANNTTAGYQLFANIMTWLTGSIQITGSTCLSTNSLSFSFLNDGGSPIVSYDWDFGDTTSSSDPTPNKVFTVAGEYDITLTVVRQDTSSDTYTDKIKIWDDPTIANAGDDLHLFTGTTTASIIGNTPNIGTGVWSRLSGPNTPTESLSDNVLDLSNLTQGTYEYEWEVTNGTCTPSNDVVRIIISDNVAPTLELTGDFTKATDSENCFYTIKGIEFDPSTASDDSGGLASLTYTLQKLAPNPNLIEENFNTGSWDTNNFELGTNTGSVVNGTYNSDTSSRGTLRTVAEFVPTLANPLYVSATLSYTGGEGIAFVGTRSTGEQPSGQFNSEPQGLNLRIHNFNDGQTSTATGYDFQPRPGNAFYTNPVRFEIIDDGASMSVTMTNLVTGDSHSFSYNTNYTSGSNRVVFSGDYSVSWDDIQISIGAHEYIQEYQNGSNSVAGITLEPGENTIVWRAEDDEGMETIKSQIITVEDTVDPFVITQNISITLDNNGEASITPSEINNNSTDNCGIDTLTLDKQNFTETDTGDNTVTLTITDINGNSHSETAIVTVINTDVNNDGLHDDALVTTWRTDNPGTSNSTSITLSTRGNGYNYDVDWDGDGIFDEFGHTGNATHDCGIPGTYTVQIKGDFPRIYFGDNDPQKILTVEQWGSQVWTSMANAFSGCENLDVPATDTPDLSSVTDMSAMFNGCTTLMGTSAFNSWNVGNVTNMGDLFKGASSFNQNIGSWNVGNVTAMNAMFFGAETFNQNIGGWNVGEVQNMSAMFLEASNFNQDIGSWNVSKVSNMSFMFERAASFNQNIGGWNVGNVTNMRNMFIRASVFNGNISSWQVGNVTDMQFMFFEALAFDQNIASWDVGMVTRMEAMFATASSFDQDISSWNVGNVTTMQDMFDRAIAFDQDLGSWNIGNVTNMANMFNGVTLSISNYDSLLSGWSTLGNVPSGIVFSGGNSIYCLEAAAREALVDDLGWTITDAGRCDEDNDGIADPEDNCPLLANVDQADNDEDGKGDVCDTDDDNDGTADTEDVFPLDSTEDTDTDSDGTGDNSDIDDDNDGTTDTEDAFPLDPNEDTDTDGDGIGDNADTDDDNDGTPDTDDAFPLDPTEDTDTDGDGKGDNADTDDDNDGTPDTEDAFPLDPREDTDTDNDGTGDNADTDDDNDGTPDTEDAFPLDPTEDTDTDNDGTGDNADTDNDNDGTPDTEDVFPFNGNEDTDTDNDGIGNNADLDDDGDGQSDENEIACGSDPLDSSSISPDADSDLIPDCSDTDVVIDDSDPEIEVDEAEGTIVCAEAITPNGDNINDTWIIQGIDKFPSAVVSVFNRYGNEVFKATKYNNDWDGRRRSNSEKLPPGSYYFVIDLRNGKAPVNGWLFINY